MSHRDGVDDRDYDVLRASGLSREQCWAVLSCVRTKRKPPGAERDDRNRRQSGVRMPPAGEAQEPDAA